MSRPPLRFKWHRLKRRRSDPPFLRANLEAGLDAGAPLELDLRATSDGHWVCLHDATLERETNGSGPVREQPRAALERLRQRAEDGTLLADPPLFLDELAAAAPGIARGYDPLLAYAAAGLPTDAAGFRALGEAAFAAMPDAAIFYLEARLVLAAARVGVCLPAIVKRGGALVDAWTVDADRPDLLGLLEELARLGCGQVTSNDPLALRALWEGTA